MCNFNYTILYKIRSLFLRACCQAPVVSKNRSQERCGSLRTPRSNDFLFQNLGVDGEPMMVGEPELGGEVAGHGGPFSRYFVPLSAKGGGNLLASREVCVGWGGVGCAPFLCIFPHSTSTSVFTWHGVRW